MCHFRRVCRNYTCGHSVQMPDEEVVFFSTRSFQRIFMIRRLIAEGLTAASAPPTQPTASNRNASSSGIFSIVFSLKPMRFKLPTTVPGALEDPFKPVLLGPWAHSNGYQSPVLPYSVFRFLSAYIRF
ncbi:hypothetical protein CVT24_009272 [Panaeolus cyanescens]|uniref:Uncharacterized protein n=1 Tax=Panaeolus cyanescens TaxID=181874 RepID=A0A409Y7W3_9AGAR|nr:hypothetical protein CVT24_009272 [Panaeolus cyanescens]